MQEKTNSAKIEALLAQNGGYITHRQTEKNKIPSWFLTDFVRKNRLIKIDKGFFASEGWIQDDYFVFQYKYPKYIYSYESALYLLNLTDNLPAILEVTGPKNYRPFSPKISSVITHTDSRTEIFNLGITEIKTNLGNLVRTYNPEKTICDIIKRPDSVDSENFIKAIRNYSKRRDKDTSLLIEYSKKMGIYKKLSEIMMVLLNEN